jgi:hypothetical protein
VQNYNQKKKSLPKLMKSPKPESKEETKPEEKAHTQEASQ